MPGRNIKRLRNKARIYWYMEERKLITKQIIKVLLCNAVKLLQIIFQCFPDGRAE